MVKYRWRVGQQFTFHSDIDHDFATVHPHQDLPSGLTLKLSRNPVENVAHDLCIEVEIRRTGRGSFWHLRSVEDPARHNLHGTQKMKRGN
jgi:hypothetical protein